MQFDTVFRPGLKESTAFVKRENIAQVLNNPDAYDADKDVTGSGGVNQVPKKTTKQLTIDALGHSLRIDRFDSRAW